MELHVGYNFQLEQEKKKPLKWSTAESLNNVFNELMLEIKDRYQFKPEDMRIPQAVIGMTRAVNDLEYFANSEYVASQFLGGQAEKPQFEEHEEEPEFVKQVREMSRNKLINKFEELVQENKDVGNSTEKLQEMVDSTKALENLIRLTGREGVGELINGMTKELLNERESHSGFMLYQLFKFDAWRDQRDRPKERKDSVESSREVADITLNYLTRALDKSLGIISEKYGIGESDSDVLQGIDTAGIDLHSREDILWEELIHKEPDENAKNLFKLLLNERFGLNSKAEEVRLFVRDKIFEAFDEAIKESRKGRLIRYGSSDDLGTLAHGLRRGMESFRESLDGREYINKLHKARLLSEKDARKIKEFNKYFWNNRIKVTRSRGVDDWQSMAISAVVYNHIYDLKGYKNFMKIVRLTPALKREQQKMFQNLKDLNII